MFADVSPRSIRNAKQRLLSIVLIRGSETLCHFETWATRDETQVVSQLKGVLIAQTAYTRHGLRLGDIVEVYDQSNIGNDIRFEITPSNGSLDQIAWF